MSKRKPALRIGGGVLNRNTLSHNPKVEHIEDNVEEGGKQDEIESQLANFMKEIDEVSTVVPDPPKENERFGNWQRCIDEKTQHPYYWNVVTDEVSWILPDEISQMSKTSAIDSDPEDQIEHKKNVERDSNDSSIQQPSFEHEHDDIRDLPEAEVESGVDICPDNSMQDPPKCAEPLCSDESPKSEKLLHEQHVDSQTADIGTQCKLCSPMCEVSTDLASMKTEVLRLRDTMCGKINFLGISNASLMQLQVLLIQIETRISDWKAKVLPTSYVLKQLKDAHSHLKAFEENATPLGWMCHWDSTAARYYYVNKKSQHKQWNYPQTTHEITDTAKGNETAEGQDSVPPEKKIKLDDSPTHVVSNPPPPPLPDTPDEKPPPPPQPEDDGYDVDDGEESPKRCDDGIMMEISDEEKEEVAEQKENKTAPLSVLSQQPIIYKGHEFSVPYEPGARVDTLVRGQRNYALLQNKEISAKAKPKKSKGTKKPVKSNKAMSSLVAQWQRAKSEIDQEDRMLEESDEDEREEPSNVKIAKWKQDQILSGKAGSNPNFEPVPTDWRTRLLSKKKNKL